MWCRWSLHAGLWPRRSRFDSGHTPYVRFTTSQVFSLHGPGPWRDQAAVTRPPWLSRFESCPVHHFSAWSSPVREAACKAVVYLRVRLPARSLGSSPNRIGQRSSKPSGAGSSPAGPAISLAADLLVTLRRSHSRSESGQGGKRRYPPWRFAIEVEVTLEAEPGSRTWKQNLSGL